MEGSSTVDLKADTINITSGVLHAVLHRQRFICPGINRECIEYQGQFITPKTFYVMADKGSLKDWKNAIRINGKKIRRYLDTGEIDFYNHAELCTGRCKSKMGNKTATPVTLNDSLTTSLTSPSMSKKGTGNGLKPNAYFENDQYSSNDSLNLIKEVDSFGDVPDVKPDIEQLRLLNVLNLRQNSDIPTSSGDQATPLHFVQVARNIPEEEEDEDAMFWRAIVQLGLIDEFFREVKSKLDVLKASMVKNYVPVGDAKKASRIVNELGMRSKLDMRLCAHKFEFDRQRDKLEKEMEQLKKKVSEYEQKKEILQQKSNTYEQLMTKKLRLEDMSTSEMQPQNALQLDGGNQDLNHFVVQSGNSNMMLMINGGNQSKEGSPKLNELSASDHLAKRARIEGISQELGQFAVHSANGSMIMVNGNQKSKSESPKLDGKAQHKAKRARIEGISQELSQFAVQTGAGMTVMVNRENSPGSRSESPASQESLGLNQSQDTSTVTQSQTSSLETLSQESISELSTE